jgi:hypothetical protein
VKVVVFGFAETITVNTILPWARNYEKANQQAIEDFRTIIGFEDVKTEDREKLLEYNFESPYVKGKRLQILRSMLERIVRSVNGQSRSLAILTRNSYGAVALLNLLSMANLAEFFNVIWDLNEEGAGGVYRDRDGWKSFALPEDALTISEESSYKPKVLQKVIKNPGAWFPQLSQADGSEEWEHLQDLQLVNIAMVDDETSAFRCTESGGYALRLPRYCKVPHFDDDYYDLGVCLNMGGIGARNVTDYNELINFIEEPWKYRKEWVSLPPGAFSKELPETLRREEGDHTPTKNTSSPKFNTSLRAKENKPTLHLRAKSRGLSEAEVLEVPPDDDQGPCTNCQAACHLM